MLGASVSADFTRDALTYTLRCPTNAVNRALPILLSAAATPALEHWEMADARARAHAGLSTAPLLDDCTHRALWGPSGLGNPIHAPPHAIDTLTVEDLAHFHQSSWSRGAVLAGVGVPFDALSQAVDTITVPDLNEPSADVAPHSAPGECMMISDDPVTRLTLAWPVSPVSRACTTLLAELFGSWEEDVGVLAGINDKESLLGLSASSLNYGDVAALVVTIEGFGAMDNTVEFVKDAVKQVGQGNIDEAVVAQARKRTCQAMRVLFDDPEEEAIMLADDVARGNAEIGVAAFVDAVTAVDVGDVCRMVGEVGEPAVGAIGLDLRGVPR